MKSSLFLVAVAIGCGTDDPPSITANTDVTGVQVIAHDCDGNLPGEQVDSFTSHSSGLHVIGIGQARYDDPFWLHDECNACFGDISCDVSAVCGQYDGWSYARREPASVHVGPGVTTLVLSSPTPTAWMVTTSADAELRRVVITGVIEGNECDGIEASNAVVPEGVTVELVDLGSEYVYISEDELAMSCLDVYGAAGMPEYCDDPAFAQWFEEDQQWHVAETTAFLDRIEQATGEKVGSFRGCYEMSTMTIGLPGTLPVNPGTDTSPELEHPDRR